MLFHYLERISVWVSLWQGRDLHFNGEIVKPGSSKCWLAVNKGMLCRAWRALFQRAGGNVAWVQGWASCHRKIRVCAWHIRVYLLQFTALFFFSSFSKPLSDYRVLNTKYLRPCRRWETQLPFHIKVGTQAGGAVWRTAVSSLLSSKQEKSLFPFLLLTVPKVFPVGLWSLKFIYPYLDFSLLQTVIFSGNRGGPILEGWGKPHPTFAQLQECCASLEQCTGGVFGSVLRISLCWADLGVCVQEWYFCACRWLLCIILEF